MKPLHLNLASRPYRDYRPVYAAVVAMSLVTAFLMLNNVETYSAVTSLLRVTPETYSTVGTEVNRGTKMFTVSGACAKTGCLEVPFGTKVSDVLAAAGGIAGGRPFKALQQGGPLSGLLPGSIAGDLALEPEPFKALGVGMGGGGLVFVDDTACVVDLNVMFAEFLED